MSQPKTNPEPSPGLLGEATRSAGTATPESGYSFSGGFPSAETVKRAYDDADLNRAIQAYRFFYPSVSMAGLFNGFLASGAPIDNKTFYILEGKPNQVLYTPNSDTPYAALPLDLTAGPITVELPPGPLIGVANDLNFRWVIDMGLPGPDAGKGGKHIILPPGYKGKVPPGYHSGTSTTNRVFLIIRSLPVGGDLPGAISRIQTVKIQPLNPPAGWTTPTWTNVTEKSFDATPLQWETNLKYWEALHNIIETEPAHEAYRNYYGELAVLGIAKGKPFAPDARMKNILERAAKTANAQMRVQSLADRRPDRIAWPDRKSWEWASLRPENGTFDAPSYVDLDAREKWFWQATFESPAMFRRKAGGGSLYWFAARDRDGAFLDGGSTYKLTVPQPVPASLFWSVTVYDTETRSEIQTDQGKAALRSLFELKDKAASPQAELYFGPTEPSGKEGQWIKTLLGKGWFVYLPSMARSNRRSTEAGSRATSRRSSNETQASSESHTCLHGSSKGGNNVCSPNVRSHVGIRAAGPIAPLAESTDTKHRSPRGKGGVLKGPSHSKRNRQAL